MFIIEFKIIFYQLYHRGVNGQVAVLHLERLSVRLVREKEQEHVIKAVQTYRMKA